MKKILFLFLAACFFFSCEKETIVIPQQHAGRTVLAFFWADNSLNSSLRNNIQTMMQHHGFGVAPLVRMESGITVRCEVVIVGSSIIYGLHCLLLIV